VTIPGQLAFEDPALAVHVQGPEPADPPEHGSGRPEPASTSALDVDVIRSSRRRKTAQARLIGSTVEIRIPAHCSLDEERDLIEHFTAKFERSRSTDGIDLDRRARKLADRFDLPRPSSIQWVGNQRFRWGSCTPSSGAIRLSERLVEYPSWVLDYVIVHELAHLRVAGHNADFWRLVEAYPLSERARGFLIAKGLEGD